MLVVVVSCLSPRLATLLHTNEGKGRHLFYDQEYIMCVRAQSSVYPSTRAIFSPVLLSVILSADVFVLRRY